MRRLLTITILMCTAQFACFEQAGAGAVTPSAGQVSDFLDAVKSAVTGKKKKRRRRRYRGSNKPVLAKPPVAPTRRPGGPVSSNNTPGDIEPSIEISSAQTAAENVVRPSLKPTSPKLKLRPALVAALPETNETETTSSVAVPTRRPRRTRKLASATNVASETDDAGSENIPAPPTTWGTAEISAAYDRCDVLLGQLTVDIKPVDPMRKGPCGTPGPVRLSALGEATSVTVRPAATLNCKTVAKIHNWLEEKVQPAAVKILQSRVVRIRNVSSYACRNRNNAKSGKLSEHALGNALDIASFVLADGRKVSVLKDWGTVKRDKEVKTAAKTEQAKLRPAAIKTKQRKKQEAEVANARIDYRVALPVFKGPVRRGVRLERVPDPGGPAANVVASQPKAEPKPAAPPRPPAKSRFLKQVHSDACGIFSTVLGPEANDAHRDHFHFDTAERNYRAYCR